MSPGATGALVERGESLVVEGRQRRDLWTAPSGTRPRASTEPGRRAALILLVFAVALSSAMPLGDAGARPAPAAEFVLSPEDNHLWAYDAASGERQLVVRAVNGGDPGAPAPARSDRRDINGQVCVSPDGHHAVTGEDTVIGDGGSDGGSSHDPRIAGWGFFRLKGSSLGSVTARQVGKLAPESGPGPGYRGDPDNYGCGFLDRDRLLTTAIGNVFPGEPANGQLFLWFGPFSEGYRQETVDGVSFLVGDVAHCEIDGTLATAGGIAVDGSDVYVAANRPDDNGGPAAVWRYRGRWPASPAECTPEFVAANLTKEVVVPALPLPTDPHALTPSAVVVSPDDTLYVSSVFSGTVAEYTKSGQWVRDLYPLSPVTPITGPTTNTPFGLAVTSDGSLWIADLGILLASPLPEAGSLVRVRFDAAGNPTPLGETVQDGLTFPDGLGVYRPA